VRGQHLDQSALAGDPRTDEALFVLLLQLLRDVLALAALVIAGSGICRQEGDGGYHQAGGNAGGTSAGQEAGLHTRTPNARS
jgi:hypothetical protein